MEAAGTACAHVRQTDEAGAPACPREVVSPCLGGVLCPKTSSTF